MILNAPVEHLKKGKILKKLIFLFLTGIKVLQKF